MELAKFAFLTLLIAPPAVSAQVTRSQNDPRPVADAVPRTGDITIDGKIDEPVWAATTPVTDFVQQDPHEGTAATQRTEIRILYDESAVYIAARMYDASGRAGVRGVLARRDDLLGSSSLTSDKIAIAFDTFGDRNSQVYFELNPLGVKGDSQNDDASYDPVWEGASAIDSRGWTAEFRIPYSQLRFSNASAQKWGMQIWRTIDRLNETDMWAFWRKNEAGGPAYFGSLNGVVVSSQPRQVEVVPYVTSRGQFQRFSSADPYRSSPQMTYRAGGDLKFNLSSSLTLNATVNPDFGQVEVDPAVVNLSVFETTFTEKRPFFVSGSDFFSFGSLSCLNCSNVSSMSLLYRRRIGRSPQLTGLVAGRSEFVDAPDATTILGAAKVTGRTENGISIGLLDAVTNRETARFRVAGDATNHTEEVEPLTNYFVGRIKKDLRSGATRIGAITTLVNRDLTNTDEMRSLRASAEAVGFDIDHRWGNRAYSFVMQSALTNITGDSAAIRQAQLSSARYYQRPDRRETTDGLFSTVFDPSRTTLSGYGLKARIAKETGDWLWDLMQNWRSPGYETNDVGVVGQTDYKWMLANVLRQWTTPGSWYRSIGVNLGAQQQLNYDGDRTDVEYHSYISTSYLNYMHSSLSVIYHPSYLDDHLTRGGPTVVKTGYQDYGFGFGTDPRAKVVLDLSGGYTRGVDTNLTRHEAFTPTITYKPSPSILVSVAPSYDHSAEAQQYVTSVVDASVSPSFYGHRYVFAALDQKTLSLDTRLNMTFTPNLTLELFAQPFLSSGAYTGFKEFTKSRSKEMQTYGRGTGTISSVNGVYTVDPDGAGAAPPFSFGNPDFNVRSLRGTVVIRWEYRVGSTLFFVWTQERDGSDAFGNFDFTRDRAALFRDVPTNVFQVKGTFWIGR